MSVAADVRELLAGTLADPHRLLGAHPAGGGVTIRAYRPTATSVSARLDGGRGGGGGATELRLSPRPDANSLFEGFLAGEQLPLSYLLEATYPDGASHVTADPYRFEPTLGELDRHLAAEGRHEQLQQRLGAHVCELEGIAGTAFAVWAPAARAARVLGDFNHWDGRTHPMRSLGPSGIWELFIPGVTEGCRYKYEIRTQAGELRLKADPFAFEAQMPPQTASVVHRSRHDWQDAEWLARRESLAPHEQPVSIYELHLGSWRRDPDQPDRWLSYREIGEQLADYAVSLGFTHVELLPIMAHPYPGSWGYQVTSYFAPTPRHGSPDDLRELIDTLHAAGIGAIVDWVPAHFPRDDWALARFDGSALYEHADPRRGEHPDWGTLVFNYGRNEVRNFLLASALHWLGDYHFDGLRVDAVASMLYLDYSRPYGEWVPNAFGGNEDLEAVAFLRELNEVLHAREPGTISAAEESTAWPGVSRPTYLGGLGFTFKWNMGWMHDTLGYFAREPIHRRHHHNELTFSLMYAFSEQFILPLSHDEVVHGKGSLLSKMAGERWQKLANLRALYGYMWAHPGKQLLFMGGEIAQEAEWSHRHSLDWHLLGRPEHAGVQRLVAELNRAYRERPALWQLDGEPAGFQWIEANDADQNVIAFLRRGRGEDDLLACVCNLSPVPREGWRLGLPRPGRWLCPINTDSAHYGGSDFPVPAAVEAEPVPWQSQPHSATLNLPPLGTVWLAPA